MFASLMKEKKSFVQYQLSLEIASQATRINANAVEGHRITITLVNPSGESTNFLLLLIKMEALKEIWGR